MDERDFASDDVPNEIAELKADFAAASRKANLNALAKGTGGGGGGGGGRSRRDDDDDDSSRRKRGSRGGKGRKRDALPGEKRRTFAASAIDGWLRETLTHLDVQPPPGELWSGHSLRKGAASGATAVGVALVQVCHMGGWSIQSKAVHDYIDPTCPASAAARRFFGWLRAH